MRASGVSFDIHTPPPLNLRSSLTVTTRGISVIYSSLHRYIVFFTSSPSTRTCRQPPRPLAVPFRLLPTLKSSSNWRIT
ncbi:hypothetical protein L1987_13808 [Smallanthus sonchifolius]|uniref:Uncharacterized protein n=1 Tax=Smallanthus sonchifolius TaxID=185202 RepID=A0ACB9JHJ6_9ASTR|nr:hypothetical protein L1987_13808 [Smallanthus sonchifolius]